MLERSATAASYEAHVEETQQIDSPLLLQLYEAKKGLKQVEFKEKTIEDIREARKLGYASSMGRYCL